MRKFLTERTLVIVLFFAAFIVFFFAQKETRKQERLQFDFNASALPAFMPVPAQPTAQTQIDDWKMSNGKGVMGNGKWIMGNGKWIMGNGKSEMENRK